MSDRNRVVANFDFNLHTLGWNAFQDLCATIISELYGVVPKIFSPQNDGGRDIAFQGAWNACALGPDGSYAVQCKHTSRLQGHLSASMLSSEVEKAARLAEQGLAKTYVLMTNFLLTGTSEAAIRRKFLDVPGIDSVEIFGSEALNRVIAESKRLRALVPRLYGLGDLGQILDERAYLQASAVLASMGDDLGKLVVTQAHQQSAKALLDRNFVLLLGDPAAGKTTIAASLSVAAIDLYKASTLKPRTPSELLQHWNPNEPNQLFWVDDAFGTTQYQRSLTEDWNRCLQELVAVIKRGSRIILTSRTYVFHRALQDLKVASFPLFEDSQVVIHVKALSYAEKAQMIYNHLKLGTQPIEFKKAIRPFLPGLASSRDFLPETARRLGNPFFTRDLEISEKGVARFVSRPVEHLLEVISTIDSESRGALAMVFVSGGRLESPLSFSDAQVGILERMGGTEAGTISALESLRGSLVRFVRGADSTYWSFQHPTVRDAMASYLAVRPELVEIYVAGTPIERIAEEVVCGSIELKGAKVRVPAKMFALVIDRLAGLGPAERTTFLNVRCDRNFLEQYLARNPSIFKIFAPPYNALANEELSALVKRCAEFGLLSEEIRYGYCQSIIRFAEFGDLTLLDDEPTLALFTPAEREYIKAFIFDDFLEHLDSHIDSYAESWEDTDDPESHFDELVASLNAIEHVVPLDEFSRKKIDRAIDEIADKVEELREDWHPHDDEGWDGGDRYGGASVSAGADGAIFSDVAD
jgi:hypothetical protein